MPDAVGGDGTVDDGTANPLSWWERLKATVSGAAPDVSSVPSGGLTTYDPNPLKTLAIKSGFVGPDGNFFRRNQDGSIAWGSGPAVLMWVGIGIVVVVVGLVILDILSFVPRKR